VATRATSIGLGLALLLMVAGPAGGAAEVALSASPAVAVVGHPVEVLVRTFVPIGQGDLDLPVPTVIYPFPSGFWEVLYPIPDYPFNVVADANNGERINIELARDPADATLWRGSFTPARSGEWTITVRNLASVEPGASISLMVVADEAIPTVEGVAMLALVVGLLVGAFIGRRFPSMRPSG
jgi:hypothetical protein